MKDLQVDEADKVIERTVTESTQGSHGNGKSMSESVLVLAKAVQRSVTFHAEPTLSRCRTASLFDQ